MSEIFDLNRIVGISQSNGIICNKVLEAKYFVGNVNVVSLENSDIPNGKFQLQVQNIFIGSCTSMDFKVSLVQGT